MRKAIHEIRLSNLIHLMDDHFENNQAAFASAIERKPTMVYQWLKSIRNIGEASARHIEHKLRLPKNALDKNDCIEAPAIASEQSKTLPAPPDHIIDQIDALGSTLDSNDHTSQALVLEAKLALTRLKLRINNVEGDQ